jgi:hypothetical protein
MLHVVFDRDTLFGSFALDGFKRQDDIANLAARRAISSRKRQHIRGLRLSAEATVEIADDGIGRQRDGDKVRFGTTFRLGGRPSGGFDQLFETCHTRPIPIILDDLDLEEAYGRIWRRRHRSLRLFIGVDDLGDEVAPDDIGGREFDDRDVVDIDQEFDGLNKARLGARR